MTIKETAAALSPAARRALERTNGWQIGRTVPGMQTRELGAVRYELQAADLIGTMDGLTIKGSAVAEIVQDEQLERLFD